VFLFIESVLLLDRSLVVGWRTECPIQGPKEDDQVVNMTCRTSMRWKGNTWTSSGLEFKIEQSSVKAAHVDGILVVSSAVILSLQVHFENIIHLTSRAS
jgi:hypothetical protein